MPWKTRCLRSLPSCAIRANPILCSCCPTAAALTFLWLGPIWWRLRRVPRRVPRSRPPHRTCYGCVRVLTFCCAGSNPVWPPTKPYQSSATQVLINRESTDRQYQLRERAVQLGWPKAQIKVVDEDLAQTGSEVVLRTGFAQMTNEVALGQVGIILCLEASRVARNNAEWYRLLDTGRFPATNRRPRRPRANGSRCKPPPISSAWPPRRCRAGSGTDLSAASRSRRGRRPATFPCSKPCGGSGVKAKPPCPRITVSAVRRSKNRNRGGNRVRCQRGALHAASRGRSYFQLLALSSAREGLPPSDARSLSSALGQVSDLMIQS